MKIFYSIYDYIVRMTRKEIRVLIHSRHILFYCLYIKMVPKEPKITIHYQKMRFIDLRKDKRCGLFLN